MWTSPSARLPGPGSARVQTIIDAGGGYRVEAGGTVALVRGSELGVLGPRDNIVVFINFESSVPIIVHGCVLQPGVGVWLRVEPERTGAGGRSPAATSSGRTCPAGPWNALEEGFTTAQQEEQRESDEKPRDKPKDKDPTPHRPGEARRANGHGRGHSGLQSNRHEHVRLGKSPHRDTHRHTLQHPDANKLEHSDQHVYQHAR